MDSIRKQNIGFEELRTTRGGGEDVQRQLIINYPPEIRQGAKCTDQMKFERTDNWNCWDQILFCFIMLMFLEKCRFFSSVDMNHGRLILRAIWSEI